MYSLRARGGLLSAAARVLGVLAVLVCVLATVGEANVFGTGSKEVSTGSKDEQIRFWRREVAQLRAGEMSSATSKLYAAEAALQKAKKKEGFFYTKPEDRATIDSLDADFRRSLVEVQVLKSQENMMLAKLKPLYGVLSTEFAREQKETIREAISTIQEMSYDNAWYSSLFNVGEAESLTDIIVGFFVQWLVGYVILYPFAILYYALWAAPRSVLQYTTGISSIAPALVGYTLSVFVMCLPLLALVGGLYLVARRYGDSARASMEEMRRRQHYHSQ